MKAGGMDSEAIRDRLLSVDIARGVAIVGMILVNAAAYFHYVAPAPVPGLLLHAHWDGFLIPDFVFPAFIFIVGVSIALSLGGVKPTGTLHRRILWRSVKLILLGVFLSNLYGWYNEVDLSKLRIFGVLQRIGLVYGATALIFIHARPRIQAAIALVILILYTAVLYAPFPGGGPTDLYEPGANIASWLDRTLLGTHAYYVRAMGYDPEGILSTLPAIAQCLLGALTGRWLAIRRKNSNVALFLASIGLLSVCVGALAGFAHPIIKDLWTASYVALSSGITMLILAGAYFLNDVAGRYGPVSHFFRVFGVNAIAAYGLHFILSFIIVAAPFKALYQAMMHIAPPAAASLAPVAAFIAINWLAMAWLWRRGIIIKI